MQQQSNPLTPREITVLFYMADRDLCVKQVAELLFISPFTVEGYTKSIRKKLGVRNLHAAVYVALRHGWI